MYKHVHENTRIGTHALTHTHVYARTLTQGLALYALSHTWRYTCYVELFEIYLLLKLVIIFLGVQDHCANILFTARRLRSFYTEYGNAGLC